MRQKGANIRSIGQLAKQLKQDREVEWHLLHPQNDHVHEARSMHPYCPIVSWACDCKQFLLVDSVVRGCPGPTFKNWMTHVRHVVTISPSESIAESGALLRSVKVASHMKIRRANIACDAMFASRSCSGGSGRRRSPSPRSPRCSRRASGRCPCTSPCGRSWRRTSPSPR